MNARENIIRDIGSYLKKKGWIEDIKRIEFLAAGEYNENYRVHTSAGQYVFRINHGSQLNIDNQIGYEFAVLKSLANSGVTPKPFFCEPSSNTFERGVLIMEFIPGSSLNYLTDISRAAYIFSQIHLQPVSEDLIVQKHPVHSIAEESLNLINRFEKHPLKAVKKRLLEYHEDILTLAEKTRKFFKNEPLCIVNSEVNSQNFIIQENRGYLVDWEKAVVSYRYQDLGHFVVPTTTLWKSDYTFGKDSRREFLKSYSEYINNGAGFYEIDEKTNILEKTIILRALSWCFMAYYEYVYNTRTLKNSSTFNKIKSYLEELECFVK